MERRLVRRLPSVASCALGLLCVTRAWAGCCDGAGPPQPPNIVGTAIVGGIVGAFLWYRWRRGGLR